MKQNAILSMEIYLDEKIYFHTKCNYKINNDAEIINFELVDNTLEKINIYIITKNNIVYILQNDVYKMNFLNIAHLLKMDEFNIIKNNNTEINFIDLPIKNFDFVIYNAFCDVTRNDEILNIKLKGSTKKRDKLYDFIIKVKHFENKEVYT